LVENLSLLEEKLIEQAQDLKDLFVRAASLIKAFSQNKYLLISKENLFQVDKLLGETFLTLENLEFDALPWDSLKIFYCDC